MRAIRVHSNGGPEELRLDEVPVPSPKEGELRIHVEAAGLNFIEVYQRKGQYVMPLPFIPGSEAAGVVREVGAGVTGFSVGDRVVTQSAHGSYAEFTTVPADRAVRIPDSVSTKQAAAVFLQGITAHYLATSTFPLAPGHRALVHAGAGGVGLLLIQIAKKRGAFVITTASTPDKRSLAKGAGADEAIEYDDFPTRVRVATRHERVHVVFDSVGRTTFDQSLDCLAPRGMMVLFGQSSGPVPPVDPQILNRKGSLFLTRPTTAHYLATRAELLARAHDVLGWVADGSLQVRIGAEFPLARAADAHRALEARETTGKVLLLP
jgi:NADPH2:quinone reductase